MATKKTPATPALPATPVTPTLPVTPTDTVTPVEPELTKDKPIKVRHKKTGNEHEVSYDYYQRNKSVLECL